MGVGLNQPQIDFFNRKEQAAAPSVLSGGRRSGGTELVGSSRGRERSRSRRGRKRSLLGFSGEDGSAVILRRSLLGE